MTKGAATKRYGRVRRAAEAAGIGRADPPGKQEVIPVEPAAPAKAPRVINVPEVRVNMPALRMPSNLLSWVTLGVALGLWYVSVLATDAFLKDLWDEGSVAWYTPFIVQIAFSVVERYLFAGAMNWFTVATLGVDAVINAWGLFSDLLPKFLRTGLWKMLQEGTGIRGVAADGQTILVSGGVMLLAAVVLGALLAWGNDKLFSLALSGK